MNQKEPKITLFSAAVSYHNCVLIQQETRSTVAEGCKQWGDTWEIGRPCYDHYKDFFSRHLANNLSQTKTLSMCLGY
jgi:hypothetical protein